MVKKASSKLRNITIVPSKESYAEGSVEVSYGLTKVLCTASLEESRPRWIHQNGRGWLTAEYNMLPRSTFHRTTRERVQSAGRTQEISRLIGRSLRASLDLDKLGERQIYIDCDVLQADAGTRVASVTGGFVALALALQKLKESHLIKENPLLFYVAGVSVGIMDNEITLDPNFEEDQRCSTDMNLVFSSDKKLIEVQATAESQTFSQDQMNQMIELAQQNISSIFKAQAQIIGSFFPLTL